MYFDDRDDQDELQQEIILRLWQAYPSFRKESQFSTWMYRVGLNTAISFFRKAKKRSEVPFDESSMLAANSDEEKREHTEQVAGFYRVVSTLGRIDKAVVFLFIEGCSHKQIASHLGISEGNARVKLSRIKSKLKTILRPDNEPV